MTLSANLPATPATGTGTAASPISSDIDVYDALGTARHHPELGAELRGQLDRVGQLAGRHRRQPRPSARADVGFGPASGNTVQRARSADRRVTGSVTSAGVIDGRRPRRHAELHHQFRLRHQTITLNLGTYGGTNGVTQYAGTQYSLEGLTQNGVPPGSFAGVTPQANGDIVVNYNNGQTRTIAQVPVVTFNDTNALQRQDGQSFTATHGRRHAVGRGSRAPMAPATW